MKFRVELTRGAESDLNRLADYIATHSSIEQAAYSTSISKVKCHPERREGSLHDKILRFAQDDSTND